jgi:cobalt-zinc-cadmium efflux system outer membrane protein
MRIIHRLGCLVALAGPGGAAAQGQLDTLPLPLETARKLAVEHSAARRARVASLDADRARGRQAAALPNPLLSIRTERTGTDQAEANQLIAEIAQPLDVMGVARHRGKAATARAVGSLSAITTVESDLLLEVTAAYLRAVATDRRLALADRTLAAFDRATRISAERLQAGDLSGLAHRRLLLEAARYTAMRAAAALAQRSERLRLGSLIADPDQPLSPNRLVLVDSLPAPALPAEPAEALIATALIERSELRELEAKVRAAGGDVEVERRARIPMVAVTAGLKTERIGSSRHAGFVAGVSVPMPLFDRRASAVAAAEADHRVAAASLEHERRAVAREVATAYESLRATVAQRQALEPRLGADARAAVDAAELAFAEGEIGVTEWLDTIRAYHEAEAMLLTLTTEAALDGARLERAVGRIGRTP